ncbi:hypothetical protein FIU89_08160 [Roseovarius sp. THAF27]|nr:hypothetical protein FIU89_08160 [Roseovarius sp. THAF27]
MILQQTHQSEGPRPTLGGRTQRSFDGRQVSRAKHPFGAQHHPRALPGGGSGAARRAAGRNSSSEAPVFDEAPK